jgi:hypothetical protein
MFVRAFSPAGALALFRLAWGNSARGDWHRKKVWVIGGHTTIDRDAGTQARPDGKGLRRARAELDPLPPRPVASQMDTQTAVAAKKTNVTRYLAATIGAQERIGDFLKSILGISEA